MAFHRAERKKAKLRLAIDGPSGSGKTYSSLVVARGLVGPQGRIAVIDTEEGSASLYSDLTPFDVCELAPPFDPRRYIEAIHDAERGGYDCIIIDSLSHAWSGQGGILEMKDKRGKDWSAWREVTPIHNALVDAMLRCPCHIIATIRTKVAWETESYTDSRGNMKHKPVKVGTKPEQREGLEYEFTVVLDVEVESHVARTSKDRTQLFDGVVDVLTVETGQRIRAWLEGGVTPVNPMRKVVDDLIADMPLGDAAYLREWGEEHKAAIQALGAQGMKEIRDAYMERLADIASEPQAAANEHYSPAPVSASVVTASDYDALDEAADERAAIQAETEEGR